LFAISNTSLCDNEVSTEAGQVQSVHRGSYSVSDLKTELGVDQVLVIDQIVDGSFIELKDDDRIVIKGGEVFISHARDGGSS
jgi:hypothetical protein